MKNLMLVIADQEHGNSTALSKANQLATKFNYDVRIFKFLSSLDPTAEDNSSAIKTEQGILNEEIAEFFSKELDVSSKVFVEQDIPYFLSRISEFDHSPLVLKTGHRTETLFHTPTDFKLIRELSCDLLLTTEREWQQQSNILAAVDLDTEHTDHIALNFRVLEHANKWAQRMNSQLHVVFSLPMDAAIILGNDTSPQEGDSKVHCPESMAALKGLLSDAKIENAIPHIECGTVKHTIPDLAHKLNSDLVVMGSVGRDGIQGMILGNKAEQVLHRLHTDILVVK